jgi:hypothetical protein
MKVPRDVPGARLADVLCRRWGYGKVHQVGSHIILETSEPTHQRLAQHKGVSRDEIIGSL